MRTRDMVAVALAVASLTGCGQSSNSSLPAPVAKAAVIITIDAEHHACAVAKYGEPSGSTVGCADVVPFVRNELRIASGSVYDVRTTAATDQAEVSKVEFALNGAGYRFVAGSAAGGTP